VKKAQYSATGDMIGENERERKSSSRYIQQNFKKWHECENVVSSKLILIHGSYECSCPSFLRTPVWIAQWS